MAVAIHLMMKLDGQTASADFPPVVSLESASRIDLRHDPYGVGPNSLAVLHHSLRSIGTSRRGRRHAERPCTFVEQTSSWSNRTPGLWSGRFCSVTVFFMSDSKSTFPTFAKFWRTARWLLLTIALVYGLLWMRYATVERVLAFDPVVAMNAGFADVPVEDRGWPEMRKALVAMHADDPLAAELLREASRCEVLGFYAGHPEDLSLEDKGLWPELVSDEEPRHVFQPLELGAVCNLHSASAFGRSQESRTSAQGPCHEPGGDGGP